MEIKVFSAMLVLVLVIEVYSLLNKGDESKKVHAYLIEAISIAIVVCAGISFFLALASCFSLLYFNAFTIILILLLGVGIWRRNCSIEGQCFSKIILKDINNKKICIVSLIWLIMVVFNALFPIEWATGWRDYSCYYYQMVHIAEEGTIFYDEEIDEEEIYEVEQISSLDFSGLMYKGIDESGAAEFEFNFLHMLSALLAYFYLLGGYRIAFFVMSIISACAAYYVFLVMQRFITYNYAVVGMFVTIFNPAEMWNSRIIVSETLCQLFIFMGLSYFFDAYEYDNKRKMLLSAVILSLMHLTRIDMYIITAGILVFFIYLNLIKKSTKNMTLWLIVYLGTTFVWSIISYVTNSYYIIAHWEMGYMDKLTYLVIGLLTIYVITLIYRYIKKSKGLIFLDFSNLFGEKYERLKYMIVILILIFVGGLKLSFVQQIPFFTNLRILSLYVSIPMIFLMLNGVYLSVSEGVKKQIHLYILYFLFFCEFLIYVYEPAIHPDHMWASRRWVTIIIPILLYFAVYGLKSIKMNTLKVVVCVFLIAFELWGGRTFACKKLLNGCIDSYENISCEMRGEKIYFSVDKLIAAMLRNVYDKNIYILDKYDGLESYLKKNGSITLITHDYDESWQSNLSGNISFKKIYSTEAILTDTERTIGYLPTVNTYQDFGMAIYELKYSE